MGMEVKRQARRFLADRLGIHEDALIERSIAARLLSLSSESLRRRPSEGPPFYKSGKWTWYSREEVEHHAAFRRGERSSDGLRFGFQPTPETLARPRVQEMHERVDLWRLREEWTRSHQLLTIGARKDSQWRMDAAERVIKERFILKRCGEGTITPEFWALTERIIGRTVPEGEPWIAGLFMLVADALKAVNENEERWLLGDLSGMPKTAPSKYGHETSRHKTEA